MKPLLTYDSVLEVPFHDVDSMGIAWHGHYIKYLEIGRTNLMRQLGLDFQQMKDWGVFWPVVSCNLKYVRPLLYGQKVRVQASLMEYNPRIRITYLLTDAESGDKVNKAETIQLAVKADTGELLFECPPQLTEALAQVLA